MIFIAKTTLLKQINEKINNRRLFVKNTKMYIKKIRISLAC